MEASRLSPSSRSCLPRRPRNAVLSFASSFSPTAGAIPRRSSGFSSSCADVPVSSASKLRTLASRIYAYTLGEEFWLVESDKEATKLETELALEGTGGPCSRASSWRAWLISFAQMSRRWLAPCS